MNHQGTQTLHTDRLTLRRFTLDDVEAMYANWAGDDQVTKYLSWPTHPDAEVTRAVLSTWVEQYAQDGFYNWAIVLNGVLIGSISVVRCSEKDAWAEIGYVIGRAQWGQGLMTEALDAVLRFLFETVGLHRVMLRHDTENIASGRVMVKNGLAYEGTLRKHVHRKDDTWGDLAIYGILREEWAAAARTRQQ